MLLNELAETDYKLVPDGFPTASSSTNWLAEFSGIPSYVNQQHLYKLN